MNPEVLRRLGWANRGDAAVACLAALLRNRAQNADVTPATPRIPGEVP